MKKHTTHYACLDKFDKLKAYTKCCICSKHKCQSLHVMIPDLRADLRVTLNKLLDIKIWAC